MDTVMLVATVVDLGAVTLLGWLTLRGRRERETSIGFHKATLESLRTDLSQLVLDAERRAEGLAQMLAGREESLRALLDDIARLETQRPARQETRTEVRFEKRRPARPREERSHDRSAVERAAERAAERATPERAPAVDPAEARLLRDLQISFGAPEA